MSANSVKSTTGSASGPTATTSVTTAVKPKTVTINGEESVQVSEESKENYFIDDPDVVNDSVFKCPGCSLLTIHQGFEFTAYHVDGGDTNKRRIYMCTNCAKFSSK